jgi:intron-binding protein aquarius
VRTRFVGHLLDVRRLVVAMSHAQLGLYMFCRCSLFEQCYELQPTFQLLLQRPDHLALNLNEITTYTKRHVEDTGPIHLVSGVEEMISIFNGRFQVCLSLSGDKLLSLSVHDWCINLERTFDFRLCRKALTCIHVG